MKSKLFGYRKQSRRWRPLACSRSRPQNADQDRLYQHLLRLAGRHRARTCAARSSSPRSIFQARWAAKPFEIVYEDDQFKPERRQAEVREARAAGTR